MAQGKGDKNRTGDYQAYSGAPIWGIPERTERDFPEDSSHENGNYTNLCSTCNNHFTGHKRRVTCKVCETQEGEIIVTATSDFRKALLKKN